jgi:hypothetical protein
MLVSVPGAMMAIKDHAPWRGKRDQEGRRHMGALLQLVGDSRANPHAVGLKFGTGDSTLAPVHHSVALRLNSQAMLRFAAASANAGFRVRDVRLDDVNRTDDPELRGLKLSILQVLNDGDADTALDWLLDWPAELIVSGLVLIDQKDQTRLYINRTGEIESAHGQAHALAKRLDEIVAVHTEIFRR